MITMILAHDEAGGIGFSNGLPWPRIKEDMKRFKRATVGHTVIMGRKTFESLGKPLPNRKHVVFSRKSPTATDVGDVFITPSLALNLSSYVIAKDIESFVIGGAEIYQQALPYANRILLTRVIGTFEADTFYKPDLTDFDLVSKEEGIEDDKVVCVFEEYVRRVPKPFVEIMM